MSDTSLMELRGLREPQSFGVQTVPVANRFSRSYNLRRMIHKRHQFRLALVGHKVAETAGVCLLLMVQGQIAQVTAGHLAIASQTGLLTVFPLLGITLTRFAHRLANRWISSALVAVCSFVADAVIHSSHYPGQYTEAALTSVGTFVLSVVVSYTPVGKTMDRLAESFSHREAKPIPIRRGVNSPSSSTSPGSGSTLS